MCVLGRRVMVESMALRRVWFLSIPPVPWTWAGIFVPPSLRAATNRLGRPWGPPVPEGLGKARAGMAAEGVGTEFAPGRWALGTSRG